MNKNEKKLLKDFFTTGECGQATRELLIKIGLAAPLQNRGGIGRKIHV